MRTRPLGVGIVGLATMGAIHALGVGEFEGARVAAVADIDAQILCELAVTFGATPYGSAEELISDPAVDAVSICLPHHLHHPVAAAAIEAGKHVLLEKPMAVTVSECDDLIARAEDAGVQLSVQHNQVFDPVFNRARDLIRDGELGDIAFIRFRLGLGRTWGGWRNDFVRSGGGMLFDAGIHRIYIARHLLGDFEVVSSVMDVPWTEGEEFALVTLRFASGAMGVIEANFHGPEGSFDDSVEIVGTAGALLLQGLEQPEYGHPTWRAPLRRWSGEQWEDESIEHSFKKTVVESVGAFCEALVNGVAPPVTPWDGREAVRIARDSYDRAQFVGRTITDAERDG